MAVLMEALKSVPRNRPKLSQLNIYCDRTLHLGCLNKFIYGLLKLITAIAVSHM